jgi:hypothetical protein
MIAQAFHSMKYEIMALSSLGILSIYSGSTQDFNSVDQFDNFVAHDMRFELSIKSYPRVQSEADVRRLWESIVYAHVLKVQSLLDTADTYLNDRVQSCYLLGMPHCHEIPEFALLRIEDLTGEGGGCATPASEKKKRVRQSKGGAQKKGAKRARVSTSDGDGDGECVEGGGMDEMVALIKEDEDRGRHAAVEEAEGDEEERVFDEEEEDGGEGQGEEDEEGRVCGISSFADDREVEGEGEGEGEGVIDETAGSAGAKGVRRARKRTKVTFETILAENIDEVLADISQPIQTRTVLVSDYLICVGCCITEWLSQQTLRWFSHDKDSRYSEGKHSSHDR